MEWIAIAVFAGFVGVIVEIKGLRKQLAFAAKQREELKGLLGNIDARVSLAMMQQSRPPEQKRA